MKITCQACEAKYTIADEKVQGKVAKIRCKKCGAAIVVNGPGSAAEGGLVPTAEAGLPEASDTVYTVNVADGDQRTMSPHEVVEAYRSGLINSETYIWTEGMDDWLPLASIPAIASSLDAAEPLAALSPPAGPVQTSSPELAMPAARRETGRQRAVDLFGSVASAGGESEGAAAMTPLGMGGPTPHAASASGTSTMGGTGARNEQSVLFSLNSLASNSAAKPPPPVHHHSADDSGLIDLGALAKAAEQRGPSYTAAVAPAPLLPLSPMLGAPMLEAVAAPPSLGSYPAKHNKTGLFVGGGIVIAALVVGGAIMATRSKAEPGPSEASASATQATVATPTPAETSTVAPPSTAVDPMAAMASASANAAKAAPGPGGVRRGGGGKGAAATQAAPPPVVAPPPTPKPASGGNCGCPPGDLNCAIKCSAAGKK